MNKYDENYFNNLAANGVISGDEIRLFVGSYFTVWLPWDNLDILEVTE